MKLPLIILLALFSLLAVGLWGGQKIVRNKITNAIEAFSEKESVSYSNLDLNLSEGAIRLDSVVYYTSKDSIYIGHLEMDGFDYFSYLRTREINFKYLKIIRPQIILRTGKDSVAMDKTGGNGDASRFDFKKKINIRDLNIAEGKLTYRQNDKHNLTIEKFNVNLKDFFVDKNTLAQKIPFTYRSVQMEGSNLVYPLDVLQTLKAQKFELDDKRLSFTKFQISPNYSRKDYIKVIPYEKDLIDLEVAHLLLQDYKWNLEDSGSFDVHKLILDSSDAKIYRNKLIRDDPNTKEMYSKMLRDLSFEMNIDSLVMKNTSLSYEEVQEKTKKTGLVFFRNMNVTASSITNRSPERKDFPVTVVDVSCLFMGQSPLKVHWSFRVNDPSDHFRIGGSISNIPVEAVNHFFEPALNMRAKGGPIKSIVFDFSGNRNLAGGTFKMSYDNLKINLLKNNGREESGFLSFIANILVSHKAKRKDTTIQVKDVKRDSKRSFWNYFWTCMFEGIRDTLV